MWKARYSYVKWLLYLMSKGEVIISRTVLWGGYF